MYLNGLLFRYELHILVHVFRVVVTHRTHASWHARCALHEKRSRGVRKRIKVM